MQVHDAVVFIRDAVPGGGTWADLGAGEGTFTRALAEILGVTGRVYAVDRDPDAVEALTEWASTSKAPVVTVKADFTGPFVLPGLHAPLDGILLANALHFAAEPGTVLARLVQLVKPGGRIVIVEYDRRSASQWVPYPIPVAQLPALAAAADIPTFEVLATRPSRYQGSLYSAVSERP